MNFMFKSYIYALNMSPVPDIYIGWIDVLAKTRANKLKVINNKACVAKATRMVVGGSLMGKNNIRA